MSSPAALRALTLLRLLAEAPAPLAASTIAARSNVPRATAYRLLGAMEQAGFALRLPDTGRWMLGPAAFEIGSAFSRRAALQRYGVPVLRALAGKTGYAAHLAVLAGDEIAYLHKEERRERLVIAADVRLPAVVTASGKAMLGALPAAQLRATLADAPYTWRGCVVPSGDELVRIVRRERSRGWSTEDEAVTPGLASIAVAVLDPRELPIASLALTGSAATCGSNADRSLVDALRQASAVLQRRLAGATPWA